MKRVFLHSKRVFAKHWFIIGIAWAFSFIFGIGMFLILLIWSLNFNEDPVDVKDILNNFTEEELDMVLAETVDENVSDEEYLDVLARYQSYFCPKKIDYMTIWQGSENNTDSYILFYEIKKEYDNIDWEKVRETILSQLNRNSVHTIRLIRSNKDMIFRYTSRETGEHFDIVISNKELMAA
jgi:hypothetical protein